jgi:hypothetical protein
MSDMSLEAEIAERIAITDDLMADYKGQIEKQASEIEELQSQLATQKEASESASPALDTQAVDTMVNKCVEAGLLKEADLEEAKAVVLADPNKLVAWVEKLASKSLESSQTLQPMGRAAEATSNKYATVPAGSQKRKSDEIFEQRFGK